jgi:hypothetical protein
MDILERFNEIFEEIDFGPSSEERNREVGIFGEQTFLHKLVYMYVE